jgi:hypothetical protein
MATPLPIFRYLKLEIVERGFMCQNIYLIIFILKKVRLKKSQVKKFHLTTVEQ